MPGLAWGWIALMLLGPLPAGALLALPVWRRRETILGNLLGTLVIFGAAFALIFRESAALDVARVDCFAAGFVTCWPIPSPFARYTIYAAIGLLEVVALFIISLIVEKRIRERDYAPEWRR